VHNKLDKQAHIYPQKTPLYLSYLRKLFVSLITFKKSKNKKKSTQRASQKKKKNISRFISALEGRHRGVMAKGGREENVLQHSIPVYFQDICIRSTRGIRLKKKKKKKKKKKGASVKQERPHYRRRKAIFSFLHG